MHELDHQVYMQMAIAEAKRAYALGEVPVGAVIVDGAGEVIARGCNRTICDHDASAHAEIIAIRKAGQMIENYRLTGLHMYVTLEPCCMCIMAAIHARINTLVFGASDFRTGACGSVFSLSSDLRHNHHLNVIANMMDQECGDLLRNFFKERRAMQKEAKQKLKAIQLLQES